MKYLSRARLFAVLSAPIFVAVLAGCADQACIEKASVRDIAGGLCPSRSEASTLLANVCNQSSDEPIQSVDSDPTDLGKICCYDVTVAQGNVASCPASRSP